MVTRQSDDFVIVKSPAAKNVLARRPGAFALVGPGLDPEGVPFVSLDEAVARGRAIAQSTKASLWDATAKEQAVLIVAFRR